MVNSPFPYHSRRILRNVQTLCRVRAANRRDLHFTLDWQRGIILINCINICCFVSLCRHAFIAAGLFCYYNYSKSIPVDIFEASIVEFSRYWSQGDEGRAYLHLSGIVLIRGCSNTSSWWKNQLHFTRNRIEEPKAGLMSPKSELLSAKPFDCDPKG